MQDFLIIAHRGASGSWPENTMLAFHKALESGAKWLELDVHLSSDGIPVVIHDSTLQRTTDGSGKVAERSFAELRQFDAGLGEKIPLLEEVLELASGRATVNIELKGRYTGSAVARLLERRFSRGQKTPDVLASSLYERELRDLSALLPKVPLAIVAEQVDPHLWDLARELDLWSINLDKQCVNRALVAQAKHRNTKLLVFTVNEPEQFCQLRELGVDGVFTDFPARFVDQ